MEPESVPAFRIGELSRCTGIGAQLLRAWEGRSSRPGWRADTGCTRSGRAADPPHAGLPRPGLSAAEAARAALSAQDTTDSPPGGSQGLAGAVTVLARSLDTFDEPAAQALSDRLLADFTVKSVLGQVIVPYLHDLGERWPAGRPASPVSICLIFPRRPAGIASRGWVGPGHIRGAPCGYPKGVGAMSVAKTALTVAALGATADSRLAGTKMEKVGGVVLAENLIRPGGSGYSVSAEAG